VKMNDHRFEFWEDSGSRGFKICVLRISCSDTILNCGEDNHPFLVWDKSRVCNPVACRPWSHTPLKSSFAKTLWEQDRKAHKRWIEKFAWVFEIRKNQYSLRYN